MRGLRQEGGEERLVKDMFPASVLIVGTAEVTWKARKIAGCHVSSGTDEEVNPVTTASPFARCPPAYPTLHWLQASQQSSWFSSFSPASPSLLAAWLPASRFLPLHASCSGLVLTIVAFHASGTAGHPFPQWSWFCYLSCPSLSRLMQSSLRENDLPAPVPAPNVLVLHGLGGPTP